MEKSYAESFALRTCHCDMHGEWRPGAILEAMQETAGTHCAQLGIGRDVTDGLGIVWVLSRAQVRLDRVPRMGERMTVETWPLPPRHLFYPRINEFRDGAGKVIGTATSLWLLLDVATRHIVNSDEVLAHLPDNSDIRGAMPAMPRIPAGEPEAAEFLPPYADFDLNGHVNNTKYLDWTASALGHAAMAEYRMKGFCVSYDSEIRPDQAVRTELIRGDGCFGFAGYVGDKRCFGVSGELERRAM